MVFWLLTLLMEALYLWNIFFHLRETPNFAKFHQSFINSFRFLKTVLAAKLSKKSFYKCLLFRWINWICFLLSNLMWRRYFTLFAIKSQRRGLTAVWKNKRNYSLKRKKQPLRAIPEKEMFLDFINVEIVGKLKCTNSLQPVTSLKSEFLHSYLLTAFFAGTSILRSTW